MLVSVSVATDPDPSAAVPASLASGDESLTRAVPSARQKTSASSVSTRLHWGQRFMVLAQAVSVRLSPPDANCQFTFNAADSGVLASRRSASRHARARITDRLLVEKGPNPDPRKLFQTQQSLCLYHRARHRYSRCG